MDERSERVRDEADELDAVYAMDERAARDGQPKSACPYDLPAELALRAAWLDGHDYGLFANGEME